MMDRLLQTITCQKVFLKGPDKKDFRSTAGEFNKTDVKQAKEYWEKAKQETGTNEVTLELLNYDLENFKKVRRIY